MKPNIKILTAVTLVIAAGAYWYFFTGTENQAPLSAISLENQTQFQTLVSELQPISFSTTIFSDPRFMALVDLATPIESETAGRVDPFAPVLNTEKK